MYTPYMWKDTPSCKLKQTNVLQFDWLQVSFTKTRHKEGCINQLYPWYKAFLLSCQACKIPPPAFTSAHGLVRTTELNSTNTTEVRQPNSCRCDVSWASDVSFFSATKLTVHLGLVQSYNTLYCASKGIRKGSSRLRHLLNSTQAWHPRT